MSNQPKSVPSPVRRARLDALLDRALRHRVTLLQASAGAGKSTLLAQWRSALAERGRPCAWLSLDRHVDDHLELLVAALAQVDPALEHELRRRLAPDREGLLPFRTSELELTAVNEALAAWGRDLCVMIDDAQFVPAGERALFARLVDRLPSNVSLILSTRSRPDLPLARMRALGELYDIADAELRFTADEAAALLVGLGRTDLAETELDLLLERTEGWAAGLRLAVLSLKDRGDSARLIGSFTGDKRLVADFFSEDVVAALPRDMQEFLLAACFLERFSAALCERVMGQGDSAAMIARVEAAGLFLVRLDDEGQWFRFHSLFAEFLCRRSSGIDPAAAATVHRRAAEWYFERGTLSEALDHAVRSGDSDLIANQLESCSETLIYDGKLWLVYELAMKLPREVLWQKPGLLLGACWMDIRGLRCDAARRLIERAEELIDAAGLGPKHMLRHIATHRRMMLAAALDQFEEVEALSSRLLALNQKLHPYLLCNLYGQAIRARRERLRFDQFDRQEALARQTLTASNHKFAFVAQQAIVGRTYFAQARLAAAERALTFGFEQAIDFAGEGSGLAALPALPMAALAYDRNEIGRAQKLVSAYLPVARIFCFSDELLDGLTLAARLKSVAGDFDGAMQALDDAQSIAAELGLPRMIEGVRETRVRVLLQYFHVDRALLLDADPAIPSAELKPGAEVTSTDESRALTRVRLELASGQLAGTAVLAQRWRSFCQGRGAIRSFIQWSLLHAQVAAMDGDRRLAQRSLRDALVAASEGRSVRLFLDEGVRVHELLMDAYGTGPRTAQPVDRFAYEILDLFKGNGRPRLVELEAEDEPMIDGRITGRELEILTFVASGLRNREIGDRLGLTEGSVKWYMQRIYDKVGTRRRSLAVERARQFGFLS